MKRALCLLGGLLCAGPAAAQQPEWQPIPPLPPLPPQWEQVDQPAAEVAPAAVVWEPVETPSTAAVAWQPVAEGEAALPQLAAAEPAPVQPIPLPPPPRLYAFNRSLAFGDGLVGPDVSWRIPNGFRWTPHHWLDASVNGFSRRTGDQSFWAWNNGDAVATINANLINSGDWSFGINHSIRSVYQGSSAAGGTTAIGEGQSSGFRLAVALGPTSGLAIGGEQLVQWDSFTDTGRTLYLAYSKAWWLGAGADPYPLLVGTASLASGRFASDTTLRFGCIDTGANRTGTYAIDNQLCWAPGGSLALVLNPQFSLFTEYNSVRWLVGASYAPIAEVPFRATWAVNLYNQLNVYGVSDNPLPATWSFRLSLGF